VLLSNYLETLESVHERFEADEGAAVHTALAGLCALYTSAPAVSLSFFHLRESQILLRITPRSAMQSSSLSICGSLLAQVVEVEAPDLVKDVVSSLLLRNFEPASPDEPIDAPEWASEVSDECTAKVLHSSVFSPRATPFGRAPFFSERHGG
jgi:hypothetical protein